MRRHMTGFGVAAAAIWTLGAQAQPAPPPAPAAPVKRPVEDMNKIRAQNAAPDSTGTGPYRPMKEAVESLPDHLVYRPSDLKAVKGKLGVLIWGNIGCMKNATSARQFLLEIASHGYVAVTPGIPIAQPAGMGPTHNVTDLMGGLDWIMAESKRQGSPYYNRIDPKLVAVAGTSCGGLATLSAAGDPRIKTMMVFNSGIPANGIAPGGGPRIGKDQLDKLRTPVLYILGGPADMAYPNGSDDYEKLKTPAVLLEYPDGHRGTFMEDNGGTYGVVVMQWLNWQLRKDRAASKMFLGPDCTLCKDRAWTVKTKGFG